jgi:aminoglycoside 3-N-acetyltransferase
LSLRSFGWVTGGAAVVIEGLLAEQCTVLVPTFSYGFAIPPSNQRPARNAWDYDRPGPTDGLGRVFTPASEEIDADMGAIPAALVHWPGRVRGNHALDSFTAVGPLAHDLIDGQGPLAVYAPLERLAAGDGWVILMGVGLNRLTLLHLAEQRAGRRLFIRWANDAAGQPGVVETGGCSEGFVRLAPALEPLARRTTVGTSPWLALPVAATLFAAVAAIRADPTITHCGQPDCDRCRDSIAGGPLDAGAGA